MATRTGSVAGQASELRPARRLSALGRSEQSSRSPRPRRYRWLNPWLLPLLLPLLWWTIPPLSPATSASYSTLLLASGGELLGARIADDGQWRFPPGAALPERLAKAIVTFEDRRFHYHPGIDPIAIARAALANLQAGRIVSGGSTLTMQLARIISGNRQRGWWQKIGEAWLALRLERALTKAEIIREWADRAPFGGNVIGFETAAWRYFGREPAQLTWAEAATLAVLPNQPGLVRPGRHETRLLERRNRLLRRLATDGELTGDDLQLALLEPLPGEPADLPMTAPHLLQSLQQRHPGLHRLQTTIDARLQQTATATVARYAASTMPQRSSSGTSHSLWPSMSATATGRSAANTATLSTWSTVRAARAACLNQSSMQPCCRAARSHRPP